MHLYVGARDCEYRVDPEGSTVQVKHGDSEASRNFSKASALMATLMRCVALEKDMNLSYVMCKAFT